MWCRLSFTTVLDSAPIFSGASSTFETKAKTPVTRTATQETGVESNRQIEESTLTLHIVYPQRTRWVSGFDLSRSDYTVLIPHSGLPTHGWGGILRRTLSGGSVKGPEWPADSDVPSYQSGGEPTVTKGRTAVGKSTPPLTTVRTPRRPGVPTDPESDTGGPRLYGGNTRWHLPK